FFIPRLDLLHHLLYFLQRLEIDRRLIGLHRLSKIRHSGQEHPHQDEPYPHHSPSPPTGPRRPNTSRRPSRPAAPTTPSASICSIIRAARGYPTRRRRWINEAEAWPVDSTRSFACSYTSSFACSSSASSTLRDCSSRQ